MTETSEAAMQRVPFGFPNGEFCVVVLSYEGAQDAVSAAMAEHMAWMTKHFEVGTILISGRRTPWTGGVMLCRGNEEYIKALVATMPWVEKGYATAEIIGFVTGMAAQALIDALR